MRPTIFLFLICGPFLSWAQPEGLIQQAEALSAAGQYGESNGLLSRFVAQNPSRLFDKGEARFLESYNFLHMGNYQAALEANTASLQLRQQFVPEGLATNYLRYGEIYLQQGRVEQALSALIHAEEFPLMDDPPSAALIKEAIGNAYFSQALYERARMYFQQSMDIQAIELGDASPGVAVCHYLIGQTYFKEGRLDEAGRAYGHAMAIEGGQEGGAPRKARLLNALGQLLEAKGGPAAASLYYKQALEACRAEYPAEAARAALCLSSAQLGMEMPAAAKENVQLALSFLCPGFEAKDYAQNPGPEQLVINRALLVAALEAKAAIGLKEGGQPALEQALASSLLGMDKLEEEVGIWGEGAGSLQGSMEVYERGIAAAYELFRLTGDEAYAARAFDISERARALLIQRNRFGREAGQPAAAQIQTETANLRHALRAAEVAFANQPQAPSARRGLGRQQEAYRRFMASIRGMDPEYYYQHLGMPVAGVPEARQCLDEQTALLSYFTGLRQCFLFVIDTEGLHLFPLESPEKLAETAAIYLKALRDQDTPAYLQSAHNVYAQLLAPADGQLKKKEKAVVIASGLLAALPFEALLPDAVPAKGKVKFYKFDYFGKERVVVYSPSAAIYCRGQAQGASRDELSWLAFAPYLGAGPEDSRVPAAYAYAFDTAYQQSPSLLAAAPDGTYFKPLPSYGEEARTIAAHFAEKGKKADLVSGAEATEGAFRGLEGQYNMIHLATHCFASATNPALAGVSFSQGMGAQGAEDDGALFAAEIASMGLNAELMVLSGFHGGLEGDAAGASRLSMALPFLDSGVHELLFFDTSAASSNHALAPLFYQSLLEGEEPGQALLQARQSLIRGREAAAPWFWAGPQLYGR
ncbi:MAG: CHAT domain-containing protein [Phaeodactylibacter sp.]|nr:CHAT domain-containing protein [Phaeodactylibacter sp.]MCB9275466.1 CHAT domain-containing protein [Lewinellaceae bacterium]